MVSPGRFTVVGPSRVSPLNLDIHSRLNLVLLLRRAPLSSPSPSFPRHDRHRHQNRIYEEIFNCLYYILNGNIIVRSFLDERGRVASRRGCEWCDTRSPKSSRTRNEPRVESESSEREPFVRLSDRALPRQQARKLPNPDTGNGLGTSTLLERYWNWNSGNNRVRCSPDWSVYRCIERYCMTPRQREDDNNLSVGNRNHLKFGN